MKTQIRVLTLILSALSVIHVFAQDPNTGYYKKTYDDGQTAYWELQWSEYFEEVEDEPFIQGDFYVDLASGGSWCDPETGICYEPQGGGYSTYEEEESAKLEKIVVTGSKLGISSLFIMLRGGIGTCGMDPVIQGDFSVQCGGADGHARPEPDPPCDFDSWSDITDADIEAIMKNPVLRRKLSEFLNESLATNKENAGFLEPLSSNRPGAYSFKIIGVHTGTSTRSRCSVDFSLSTLPPPGSIFVHTHPFGENEITCNGNYYESGPSAEDWSALDSFLFEKGLILDKSNLVVFGRKADGSEDVSEERKCGL